MSVQITVRIADDLVRFVDEQVAAGARPSRASVVERALRRELRRHMAEEDLRIYASIAAEDDESAAMARHRAEHPVDLSHLD